MSRKREGRRCIRYAGRGKEDSDTSEEGGREGPDTGEEGRKTMYLYAGMARWVVIMTEFLYLRKDWGAGCGCVCGGWGVGGHTRGKG